MKLIFDRSQFITAAALFATAAVAFSVGRLSNPAGHSAVVGESLENPAAGGGRGGMVSASGSGASDGRNTQFATGQNGARLTLAELTNGKPLDKWLKNLLAQDDEIVRMTGLINFLDATTDPADLKTAMEAINLRGERGFGRGSRFTEYGMLLQKWTQLDAKGAIAFVESRDRDERWIGTSAVLKAWTRLDPSAAIAWAESSGKELPAPEWEGRGGPGGGAAQGNFALSMVVSQLARTDLDRALSVAATQKYDSRSRTLDSLASELVSQRGLAAARAALDALPEGGLRDGLALNLAGRFASADPAGTAQWALALAPGDTRSRALAEVVGEWAKADAVAAGNFLAKLPADPESDRSRESYAQSVVQKDPAGAMAWASAITEEQRRLRAVESVARSWMRADEPAAKAWVAQSPLPDEVKSRIQSPPSGAVGFSRGRGGRGN
jgi:hypothetical protein